MHQRLQGTSRISNSIRAQDLVGQVFADYRATEDPAGIDWAAWSASVEKLLDPNYKPPFTEADTLPGAPSLTYGTALRFDSVVKETIYTTDMTALLKVADVRFEYYAKEHLPAVSWVQVQRLLDPGFLVEVEVVAELP